MDAGTACTSIVALICGTSIILVLILVIDGWVRGPK